MAKSTHSLECIICIWCIFEDDSTMLQISTDYVINKLFYNVVTTFLINDLQTDSQVLEVIL